MASPWERPLDHRCRGEHPVRTLACLLRADRRRLLAAVAVFTVKHSPVWLLPLITASIIDTVVQHQPVSRLWASTGHPVHPADQLPAARAGTTTLAGLAPVITKGLESVRSVGEVLQAPELEDNEGKAELTALRGAVTFEQVDYAYGTDGRTAVRDFTLDVAPGETIALVGASGAGKSTVLNLVIGFIRPTSGRLLLDGADMNAPDLRTYRRFLSVVPQESVLFDGTIRENVAYGMDDADEETVRAALRQALVRLLHGRTTFVVAHRLSTVQGADRIVVMGDGRVEEIGTHEELLHRGGVYAALHSGQIA
ncbi:ATP-binding cassette domain-containing protein [Streptomyces luteogriseus]|uniref:ATP-binding cassette domain-containing protein n=1 Tax=Streptomyces luteogriseus TaxID=68233 RepID=UPI0036843AC4